MTSRCWPRCTKNKREFGSRRTHPDAAVDAAIGESLDVLERDAVRNFLAGVIELFAADEVDGGGGLERALGVDHGLRADQTDQHVRIVELQ